MAEKKAYYIEIPEMDFRLLLMDDGERKGILSGMSEELRDYLLSDVEGHGYDLAAFGSVPTEFEGGHKGRLWEAIEWQQHAPSDRDPIGLAPING